MKRKDVDLDIKSVSDDGTFEGMCSIFNAIDSAGEKVIPGAFAESLTRHRRKGTAPLMFWQHDQREPIGVWEDLAEDGRGLWGKGRLILGVSRADEAYKLLKAKAVRGLSIGYREIEAEPDGPYRALRKLDLMEVSVVSFGACPGALIDTASVKSEAYAALRTKLLGGDRPSLREWEHGLRDALDLSRSEAERVIHAYKSALGEPGDTAPTDTALADLRAALAGLT
jgi:HK97 family phage prohead protease